MADTKLTALAALTGANVATGDELALVDVSDASMAASGTDKNITADELSIALPRLNAPMGVETVVRGTTASLASTYDRALFAETVTLAALATGRLSVYRIALAKGMSLGYISFCSGNTAAVTPTNQWFALFDSARVKVAITADDGSTVWGTNSKKTLAITGGPFVTTYSGWYWLGICVVASTVPALLGLGSLNGTAIHTATPTPRSSADSSLTNPASCPSPFTMATAQAVLPYAEVS